MRESDRHAKLTHAEAAIRAAQADRDLAKRIAEAQGGYPSTQYGRLTSRSHESPVEAQAMKPDPATRDLTLLTRIVNDLADLATDLDSLRRRYPEPHRADPNAIRNDKGEPGCELCARQKRWSPPLGKPTNVTGEDGRFLLPRPYNLCQVCANLCAKIGRLPLPHEHKAAHETGKVKVRAK